MTLDAVENLSVETRLLDVRREAMRARPTCAVGGLGSLNQGLHELHMHYHAEAAAKA